MHFITFFRKIMMPKLYGQSLNLADIVTILRDDIATRHQPNPGPCPTKDKCHDILQISWH